MNQMTQEETALWTKEQSLKLFNYLKKQNKEDFLKGVFCFRLADLSHGNEELFFERKKDISYNPRAARLIAISQQLLKKENFSFNLLALLSSLFYLKSPDDLTLEKLKLLVQESDIKKLNELSRASLNIENKRFLPLIEDEIIKKLVAINFMDRIRHAHLSKTDTKECISLYEIYYQIIPDNSPNIASAYKTWHKRALISSEFKNA